MWTGSSQESVTEEWRAAGLFTNRARAIRRFMDYIQADPPRSTVLFVQGDGGYGKTLLLRYLRHHCCKRFDPRVWTGLQRLDDDAFKARVSNPTEVDGTPRAIPACLVDFDPRGASYRPQDAYDVLLKLHRELAPHGLHFPLYDIALLNYLQKTHQASEEQLKSLFPKTELDFVAALATVGARSIPFYGFFRAVAEMVDKHVLPRLHRYLQQRNLPLDRLDEIGRMDHERDLLPRLPALFGEDLCAAMALQDAPPRVVLFFDTHEAFWVQDHLDFHDNRNIHRDEWLRRLLRPLVDRPCGVVLVVAGRYLPRWPQADRSNIDLHILDGLTDKYARAFLEQCGIGITDPELQQSLLDFARLHHDDIHPLHLGLAADIVLAARAQGRELTAAEFGVVPDLADKNEHLLGRLLRWIDTETASAVRALSACRSFNADIYYRLAADLHFVPSRDTFEVLTGLSFVRTVADQGQGWYRFHDLLRRVIRAEGAQIAREANSVMERYYADAYSRQSLVDLASPARERCGLELLYHRIRENEQAGVALFRELAENLARTRLPSRLQLLLQEIKQHSLQEESSRLWAAYYDARMSQLLTGAFAGAELLYQKIKSNSSAERLLISYILCDLGYMYLLNNQGRGGAGLRAR